MKILNTNKKEIHISNNELCSNTKILKYGKFEINFSEFPKCRKCGSDLIFMKNRNQYQIVRCENEKCETQHISSQKRLKYFLTDEEFEQYSSFRKSLSYFSIEYWLKKGFSMNDAISKVSEIQRSNAKKLKPENRFIVSKKNLEEKFGKEVAEKMCKEKSRFTVDFWIKRGFSKEEAINKIAEIQNENSRKCRAVMKANKDKYKDIYKNQVGYWIKRGFSEDQAINFVKERQTTFSLKKCIEKYGENEGKKRFIERQLKWQKSLHDNNNLHVGFSAISQKLFDDLLKFYPKDEIDYIFYGTKNREYSIRWDNKNFIYDFVDLNKRKIIEFNGDIYHGNPILFEADDHPNPFYKEKTAKEMWDFDKLKIEVANKNGFETLVIWESDFRDKKKDVIEQCRMFLQI